MAACLLFPLPARAEDARVGPGASIWTPAARERMARDALKVAPPAMVRLIRLHPEALLEGIRRGEELEGQTHHRQQGETPGLGAAAALATVGRKAVDALDGHRPVRELVYYLGLAAHFATDLSDPVLTWPDAGAGAFSADYAEYVEANLARFPVVFYGYPDLSVAAGGPPLEIPAVEALEGEGYRAAAGARRYFPHLSRSYAKTGGSSLSFDVRSIPFGVASLCYSRGVTNIARAWLHIWRSARGDISETPHLIGADPSSGIPSKMGEAEPASTAPPPPPTQPERGADTEPVDASKD